MLFLRVLKRPAIRLLTLLVILLMHGLTFTRPIQILMGTLRRQWDVCLMFLLRMVSRGVIWHMTGRCRRLVVIVLGRSGRLFVRSRMIRRVLIILGSPFFIIALFMGCLMLKRARGDRGWDRILLLFHVKSRGILWLLWRTRDRLCWTRRSLRRILSR